MNPARRKRAAADKLCCPCCAGGERFAGRIEAVRRGGALAVRAFWPEAGARDTPALRRGVEEAAQRLCAMNGLERVTWAE